MSVVRLAAAQSDEGRGGAADLEGVHHVERLERKHRDGAVAGVGEEAELLLRVERHVVVAEVTLHGALSDLQRLHDLGVRTVAVAVRVQCDDLQGVFDIDALGVVVEDEPIRLPVRSHGDFRGDGLGAFLDPERDDHQLRLGVLGVQQHQGALVVLPGGEDDVVAVVDERPGAARLVAVLAERDVLDLHVAGLELQARVGLDPADAVRRREEHLARVGDGTVDAARGQMERVPRLALRLPGDGCDIDAALVRPAAVDPRRVADLVVHDGQRDVIAAADEEARLVLAVLVLGRVDPGVAVELVVGEEEPPVVKVQVRRVALLLVKPAVHDLGLLLERPVAVVAVVDVADAGSHQHPAALGRAVLVVPHAEAHQPAAHLHLDELLLGRVELLEPFDGGERPEGELVLLAHLQVSPAERTRLQILHEQPGERARRLRLLRLVLVGLRFRADRARPVAGGRAGEGERGKY